jgi:hypothetical protein
MPKLQQAHKEMLSKLLLNGVPVYKKTSARTTVTAGVAPTLTGITDIYRVTQIMEMAVGDDATSGTPVGRTDDIIARTAKDTLNYYAWNGETVQFGALTKNRDVIVTYFRQPTTPTAVTDSLDFTLAEIYLGPRTAALAVMNKDASLLQTANQMAEENLSRLVRAQVKGDQNLPVRRKPFSVSNRRGIRFA